MKRWFIAGLVLLLSTTGGVQFYESSYVQMIWIGLFVVMVGLFISTRSLPPLLFPALIVYMGAVVSFFFNLDIVQPMLIRSFIMSIALGLMIWAGEQTEDIQEGITMAAFAWPVVLLVSIWFDWDNRNVWGFWSALFLVVASHYGDKFPPPMFITMAVAMFLTLTQSRGAILAGITGLVLPHIWGDRRQMTAFILAWVGLVWWMFYWSPGTALNRLDYWSDALYGWSQSPWVGLGPGGLAARQIISDPAGGHQVHAHNFVITWLAECGLLGMILVGWAIEEAYRLRDRLVIEPWQVAAVVVVLVHSMVDEPLYWPGPLVSLCVIIGSIRLRRENSC